jgi:uncharacterized protein (DUF983 family)
MSNPWDDLEPSATPEGAEVHPGPPGTSARTPGGFTVLLRGATKRCPRCGQGRLFKSWFKIRDRCPRCGLRLEREEGGFLGAMTLNYGMAFVIWGAMIGVWLAFTVPDVPVVPIMIASIAVLVGVPLWFFPRSKSLWAAIEFLVYRSDPDYRTPVRRSPRAESLE